MPGLFDKETAPLAEFEAGCERGELRFQRAPSGEAIFPPRLRAPGTGEKLIWETSSGRGTVYSTTVIRARDAEPRNLALIELEDGFRMMSRVIGVPPEEVAIGMAVGLEFEDGIPVFRSA